jgi:hypothetical protein
LGYYSAVQLKIKSLVINPFAILNRKLSFGIPSGKHCLSRMAGGQLTTGTLNLLSSNNLANSGVTPE